MKDNNMRELEEHIDIESVMKFLQAASEDIEWGQTKTFICPICGAQATASRSDYNGHHRAFCPGCEMNFIE